MPDVPGENSSNNDNGGNNEWIESMKGVDKEPAKQFCEEELKEITLRTLVQQSGKDNGTPEKEEFVNKKLQFAKELVESVVGECMDWMKHPRGDVLSKNSEVKSEMGNKYKSFVDDMFIVGYHKQLASEHPEYSDMDLAEQGKPGWALLTYGNNNVNLADQRVREYVLDGLKEFVEHAKENLDESYEKSYREELARSKEEALGVSVLEAMSGWFESTPEE